MEKLEIERRWLVDPNIPKEFWKLTSLSGPYYTTQDYLHSDGDTIRRIRYKAWLEGHELRSRCMFTTKKKVDEATAIENESSIKMQEYLKLLKDIDPATKPIFKERYVFGRTTWALWELDIFKGRHEGLVILEAELEDKYETIHLPKELKIIKEITGLKEYSNYALAHK